MSEPLRLTLLIVAAAAAGSFAVSLVLTAWAVRLCPRLGFVDHPGGDDSHKSHCTPTPYGGGTAMLVALLLPAGTALALAWLVPAAWVAPRFGELLTAYAGGLAHRSGPLAYILLGAVGLHVLGLLDDVRARGPWLKLAVIVAAALLAATHGQVRIAQFAGPAGSLVLTVAWIVVITNSFNFLDNMDGLGGGVAAICALFLAVCGVMAGQVLVPALGGLLTGAAAGFLVFNFPPARVFMGDAGSLLLGYLIAVLAALTTYYESGQGAPPYALAMPLVILAVPLYDFASVVLIRLLEGRSPLRGDRRHFSHRLVDRGLSRRFAVLTIWLASATTGLLATLLPGAGLRTAVTVLAAVAGVLGIVAILETSPQPTPDRQRQAGGQK